MILFACKFKKKKPVCKKVSANGLIFSIKTYRYIPTDNDWNLGAWALFSTLHGEYFTYKLTAGVEIIPIKSTVTGLA